MEEFNELFVRRELSEGNEYGFTKEFFDTFAKVESHEGSCPSTKDARAKLEVILGYAALAAQSRTLDERFLPLIIERASGFVRTDAVIVKATYAMHIYGYDPGMVPGDIYWMIERGEYDEEVGRKIDGLDTASFRALLGILDEKMSGGEQIGKPMRREVAYNILTRLAKETTQLMMIELMGTSLCDPDPDTLSMPFGSGNPGYNSFDLLGAVFAGPEREDSGDDEKGCEACFLYDGCCPFYDSCPHGKPKHNPEAES